MSKRGSLSRGFAASAGAGSGPAGAGAWAASVWRWAAIAASHAANWR